MKSGSLNLLQTSGSVQAYNVIALPYSTSFNYKSKHYVLTAAIVFNSFLGPQENLQVFEYPDAVWS
jgi:hypothetical protein